MKILHMYPLSGPQSGKDWRAQGDRNEREKKNLFLEIEMNAEKKKGWRTHTCYSLVRLMLQDSSHSEKTMY